MVQGGGEDGEQDDTQPETLPYDGAVDLPGLNCRPGDNRGNEGMKEGLDNVHAGIDMKKICNAHADIVGRSSDHDHAAALKRRVAL